MCSPLNLDPDPKLHLHLDLKASGPHQYHKYRYIHLPLHLHSTLHQMQAYFESEEGVRLLKLYYYSVVEHVRSTDGLEAWQFSQKIAYSFATPAEVTLFKSEFGPPQSGRKPVVPVRPPNTAAVFVPKSHKQYGGLAVTSARLQNRATRSDELCHSNANAAPLSANDLFNIGKPQDPTQGKPLLVLVWLRLALRKLERRSGEYDKHLNKLVAAYNGIDKVDKMVLPLPYCQLLKIFLFFWVYSLPLVIVGECGEFTPYIMALIATAFFGLDQLGAELEGPFGTDDNDFPLLHMGLALMDNMDSLLRSIHNQQDGLSQEKAQREATRSLSPTRRKDAAKTDPSLLSV